ncbi:hypothetical protein ACIQUS_23165 [Pseudomonas sp. NPDC090755]|uniref:hypothetical protein n=1 Tax=Pseudomonas sp. NPDC090755 TaxID=3364481 RepID=UPI00383A9FE7
MANVLRPRPSNRTFASITMSTTSTGESEPIDLTGLTLTSISMPAAWSDARIGFQAVVPGTTTYQGVFNTAGDNLTYITSANRTLVFTASENPFAGLQAIKLVSMTTAGVAVAQAATRTIKLGLS